MEVGLFYDSLLGKLIAWGETRDNAIARMCRALDEMMIVGLPTSQPFHRRVMVEPDFRAGDYDIEYLDRVGGGLLSGGPDEGELERIAVAAALAEDERRMAVAGVPTHENRAQESAWLLAARRAGLR
jgi:acetyl-CoA carboxylase biotin carboxylase subunit